MTTTTLQSAATTFVSAFGGDVPDWIQGEYDALVEAIERAEADTAKAALTVWVVSLEWNTLPDGAYDGLVGVFLSKASADQAAEAERKQFDAEHTVYQYSQAPNTFCIACGERAAGHTCTVSVEDAEDFCDCCGAELDANNVCNNDHDEWDIDVHVTEMQAKP